MIDEIRKIAEEMEQGGPGPLRQAFDLPGYHRATMEWSDRLTALIDKWGPFVEAAAKCAEAISEHRGHSDLLIMLAAYRAAKEKP
jgi:hypothetical protein